MGLTRREWLAAAAAASCSVSERAGRQKRTLAARKPRPTRAPIQSGHSLLKARHPSLGLAHLTLGEFPTRCEHAKQLSRKLGLELWVKRDDLASTFFGGGKVRKLELLLADARQQKRTSVVTFGGAGSNQCLATALFAPRAGLKAEIVLAPQPPSTHVAAQLRAMANTHAQIHFAAEVGRAEAEATAAMGRDPKAPAAIPAGGTNALGNLAYVSAALELDAQIRGGLLPEPSWIVIAAGTLGSAVGLSLGLTLTKRKTRVLAVRASSQNYSNMARARALYEETARFASTRDATFPKPSFDPQRLVLESRELGGGYGRATPAGDDATRIATDLEGYHLEPTYTAKALAALIRTDRLATPGPILLWLTQSAASPPQSATPKQRLPRELHAYLDT